MEIRLARISGLRGKGGASILKKGGWTTGRPRQRTTVSSLGMWVCGYGRRARPMSTERRSGEMHIHGGR